MVRIQRRSNLTRAAERAPLQAAPISSALQTEVDRLGTRPPRRIVPADTTVTASTPSTALEAARLVEAAPGPSDAPGRTLNKPDEPFTEENPESKGPAFQAQAQQAAPLPPPRPVFRTKLASPEPTDGERAAAPKPKGSAADLPPTRSFAPRLGNRLFGESRNTTAKTDLTPDSVTPDSVTPGGVRRNATRQNEHGTVDTPPTGLPDALPGRKTADKPSIPTEKRTSPGAAAIEGEAVPIRSEKPIPLPGIFQKNARSLSTLSTNDLLPGDTGREALPPTVLPTQEPMAPLAEHTDKAAQTQGYVPSRSNAVMTKKALLEETFHRHPDLPAQSMLLGVGDDHLPVVLDLQDATTGAVVVIGDERDQQIEMLHTAIASLALRNAPRDVQFLVLSCDVPAWQQWVQAREFHRHCLAIESAEAETVSTWILRLADWTEQRRAGVRGGPPIVLVMDTLRFMMRLPEDVRLNFDWMAKEGPLAGIWPIAAISSELGRLLQDRKLLNAFPMRVYGYLQDPNYYTRFTGINAEDARGFGQPGQFAVSLGSDWLRFGVLDSTPSR